MTAKPRGEERGLSFAQTAFNFFGNEIDRCERLVSAVLSGQIVSRNFVTNKNSKLFSGALISGSLDIDGRAQSILRILTNATDLSSDRGSEFLR